MMFKEVLSWVFVVLGAQVALVVIFIGGVSLYFDFKNKDKVALIIKSVMLLLLIVGIRSLIYLLGGA